MKGFRINLDFWIIPPPFLLPVPAPQYEKNLSSTAPNPPKVSRDYQDPTNISHFLQEYKTLLTVMNAEHWRVTLQFKLIRCNHLFNNASFNYGIKTRIPQEFLHFDYCRLSTYSRFPLQIYVAPLYQQNISKRHL